jgi:hypothetical protein
MGDLTRGIGALGWVAKLVEWVAKLVLAAWVAKLVWDGWLSWWDGRLSW